MKTPPGFLNLALPVVVTLLCLAVARALDEAGLSPHVAPALLAALLGVIVCWLIAALCVTASNGRLEFRQRKRKERSG